VRDGDDGHVEDGRVPGDYLLHLGGIDVLPAENVRTGILLVLSVDREYQGRGIGQWVVRFLMAPAVRAIESAVPFFVKLGYRSVYRTKGRRYWTAVMVSKKLERLARAMKHIADR
jgi:GNAT superfamily N-acetyltransferase